MAETVTGYLRDFTGQPIPGAMPELEFIAREPATGGTSVLVRKPVLVVPAPDGLFSVSLVASDSTIPRTVYDIRAKFYGNTPGEFHYLDLFMGLHVPAGGGNVADLIDQSGGSQGMVWISSDDSTDPAGSKVGDLVYNPVTNVLTVITA